MSPVQHLNLSTQGTSEMNRSNSASPSAASLERRVVQGELMAASSRSVPGETLDDAVESLSSPQGLMSHFAPAEKRRLKNALAKQQTETVTRITIHRIESEADLRVQAIQLKAKQDRANLLAQENAVMGRLKREQIRLATDAMREEGVAEARHQVSLRKADMFDSHREMLSELYEARALGRIQSIARDHGAQFSSESPDESAGDAE